VNTLTILHRGGENTYEAQMTTRNSDYVSSEEFRVRRTKRSCLLGCSVRSRKNGALMDSKLTLHDVLTPKQFRVALLVTSGLKNSEIGVILQTTENMIKNILRDVYDRSGCSNRVELALLLVHESETGMYEGRNLDRELARLRKLVRGLDDELAPLELALSGRGRHQKSDALSR
jgi:DNA-binding CsgD family transcriptional regulator